MNTDQSNVSHKMLPAERRSVLLIALIAMLRMFGLFALLPVLALYAATLVGATPLLIGVAVGGYGLTQAALQLPFGALSDRIGRRPVIWIGLVMFAAGSIVAGMSDTIYGVIGGRFLQGAGAVSATLAALLADRTRPAVRTRSMAVFGVGIGSSFLLALIFGPLIAAATGTRSLFWVGVAAAVIAAVLLLLIPGNKTDLVATSRGRITDAFRPALLQLDASVFLLHAILTAMFVALPFVLRDQLFIAAGQQWKIYVGALVLSLAGTVPLIIADERKSKAAVFVVAILMLLAGLVVLAFAPLSANTVLLGLAVFFAGFNFLEAGLPSRLSILAPESSRGAAMGVFSSSQFLGAFVGGVAGGVLLGEFGAAMVFVAGTATAVVWLLALQVFQPSQ